MEQTFVEHQDRELHCPYRCPKKDDECELTSEVEVCPFQECFGRWLCSTCHSINLEHYRCDLGVDARCRYEDDNGDVDADNVDGYAAVDMETDGGT